jgi:hypothetical protein
MSASSLLKSASSPYGLPCIYLRMLLYHVKIPQNSYIYVFGNLLEPRYIFGAGSLDQ